MKRLLIITSAIFVALAAVWSFAVAPHLLSPEATYEKRLFLVNKERTRFEVGAEWSEDIFSNTYINEKATGGPGTTANVERIFQVETIGGDVLYTVDQEFSIDRRTGRTLPEKTDPEGEPLISFIPNVRKQSYTLWIAGYVEPVTIEFAGERTIQGSNTYHYHSETRGSDQTEGYSFLDTVPGIYHVVSDFKIDLWVEPLSGTVIDYRDEGHNYYVEKDTGERIWQIDIWSNHFADHVINAQIAKAVDWNRKTSLHRRTVPSGLLAMALMLLGVNLLPGGGRERKTRLKVRTVTFLVFASIFLAVFAFGAVFSTSSYRANSLMKEEKITRALISSVFRLEMLTDEYVRNRESRSLEKWQGEYAFVANALEFFHVRTGEQQEVLDDLRDDHEQIRKGFAVIVETMPDDALNEAIINRVMERFEMLVDGSFQLTEISRHKLESTGKIMNRFLIGLYIIILGALAYGTRMVRSRISMPIEKFQENVMRIGTEGFQSPIDASLLEKRDEIGNLAMAFNKMIEQRRADEEALQKAHNELEKKVDERTRDLADALKASEAASQAKTDFLAGMSHELRTPLNAIIGFSEVLREGYFGELGGKQAEYIDDIHGSGLHLLSLINDVLDLVKVEAGRMELVEGKVDVTGLINDSLLIVRHRCADHDIALDSRFGEGAGELEIAGDERKLKQVLFNLLSNAAKFTENGGTVQVETLLADGDVMISVTDSGVGIAKEDLERIFDEFYQVKGGVRDKTPGTGLGLSLTRSLVELHGGRIWVESDGEGKGSTFTFTIPVKVKVSAE